MSSCTKQAPTNNQGGKAPADSSEGQPIDMSSGGFTKYRCKYFYTREFPNWVYVNGKPCVQCMTEGYFCTLTLPYPPQGSLA